MAATKLIFFDCDSTLSAIEGIDELARIRGENCFRDIELMTNKAMEGEVPISAVFGRRLEIIRPTRDEAARVGQMYIDKVEPTALATISLVKSLGWTPIILSAGNTQVIAPLAAFLGIDQIEAVKLKFDEKGEYVDYDRAYPTTRNSGKPARILQLMSELHSERTIMVGDGISDLETIGTVDLFVGFGRYIERPKVKAGATLFINSLNELPPLLNL